MKSHIRAYTLWYSTQWPGCVVYEIEAESGREAKAEAIRRRLELERSRWSAPIPPPKEERP